MHRTITCYLFLSLLYASQIPATEPQPGRVVIGYGPVPEHACTQWNATTQPGLAVVLHGSGARAALTPQAHTKHFDVPNGSQGLIKALGEAGLPARTMLSQRHAFHAGNQADVLKHVVLTGVLGYPLLYLPTHIVCWR